MHNIPELLAAGLLLTAFFGVSYLSQKLKLPSVLLFIILGMVFMSLLAENEVVHLLAEIGIILLFFILGLEFPVSKILTISKSIWPAGIMDIGLNLGVPILVALIFKLNLLTAFMIGGILYASSSSITVKLLEENKRLAGAEAEFILALLIFEDLISPILISFLAGLNTGQDISIAVVFVLLLKVVCLTGGAIFISHYGFSRLADFISNHIEKDFMPLLTIGIALSYSGLAIYLGLSEILGAFLAGVMLAETGKSTELEDLLLPVRDLVLPFFFLWFGTTIVFGEGVPLVLLLTVLVVWSIVGKVLVGVWGGKAFGLSKRYAWRAGFSLIQRGEFSIVVASMAVPQIRLFGSLYIIITTFIGTFFFQKAPSLSKWIVDRKKKQGSTS